MDFQSAHEAKLKSVSYPDVIRIAASLNRILVTSDLKTMPRHFADFLATTGHCPGIFLIKQNTPDAVTIESLIIVWSLSTPAEWENRILEIQL